MGAIGRASEGPDPARPRPAGGAPLGGPALGSVIGDCELLAVMGAGAMGIVYHARQRSLGRPVALKVIRDEIARLPEYRERFLREARLAASVDHPHVVSVYDAGEQDGLLYLTMQWVAGEDLRQLLEQCGRLDPDEAAAIAEQLAGALDAIHAVRLIHRDVKPANIIVRDVGGHDHAYLTDFGLVKLTDASVELTKAGRVLGTPGYLSPEQIEGEAPGPRSDLYALGCVVFEMLTGQSPFQADGELALLTAHVLAPRPRPSKLVAGLGTDYDAFFAAALAVDPEERFPSGHEFARDLAAVARGDGMWRVPPAAASAPAPTPRASLPRMEAVPARPTAVRGHAAPTTRVPTTAARRRRRRRWGPGIFILCLIALAGGAVGGLIASGRLLSHHTSSQSGTATAGGGQQSSPPPSGATSSSSTVQASQSTSSAATTPGSCGGDLTVGANTSCGFAHNVEAAYDKSSGGTRDLKVYSPKTGLTYDVHCTGAVPHVCTTAEGAVITFSSSPSYWTGSAPPAGLTACDQNVAVGPKTSCPFADNVFKAYAGVYQQGIRGSIQVAAASPETGQTYQVQCGDDGKTVRCATTNGGLVSFPLRAVQVY